MYHDKLRCWSVSLTSGTLVLLRFVASQAHTFGESGSFSLCGFWNSVLAHASANRMPRSRLQRSQHGFFGDADHEE
jgi:hypothetical protein